VPRCNRDYTAKPVPQSNEDKGQQFFGKLQKNGSRSFKAQSSAPKIKCTCTEQEHKHYQEEGRCFRCRSTKHITKSCPERHNVPSTSSGGPPGLAKPNRGVASNAIAVESSLHLNAVGLNLAKLQLQHNSMKKDNKQSALCCNAVTLSWPKDASESEDSKSEESPICGNFIH
jgi:hypothetical protein